MLYGATVRPLLPARYIIDTHAMESIGVEMNMLCTFTAAVSAAWPVANKAIYIPFSLSERQTVTALFIANGATVSGNIDLGIYDEAGTRLVSSGSTAQAGTTALQVANITDTVLEAGLYYMACAMDGTTGTAQRWVSGVAGVEALRFLGVFEETSAFALPATAAFATIASDYIPHMGVLFKGA